MAGYSIDINVQNVGSSYQLYKAQCRTYRTGTAGVQTNICGAEIHRRLQAHGPLCPVVFVFVSPWVKGECTVRG